MNISVAAFAICSFDISGSQRFPMYTVAILRLLFGMAGNTSWFLKTRIVRKGLDVGVAIHAGEHGTMNRSLECVSMHVFAVDHRGVAVTGKAIVTGKLGGGGLGSCVRKPGAGKHQAHYQE
jgi:hypothetical protein